MGEVGVKYAKEVLGLLAVHPDRRFKMMHIVRHVTKARELCPVSRQSVRVGVRRALNALIDSGHVIQIKTSKTEAFYAWPSRDMHKNLQTDTQTDTLEVGKLRP